MKDLPVAEYITIGALAQSTGVSVSAIRYYEEIGLVTPARTEGNDYRDYSVMDIEHLRFLQRARAVGFNLEI